MTIDQKIDEDEMNFKIAFAGIGVLIGASTGIGMGYGLASKGIEIAKTANENQDLISYAVNTYPGIIKLLSAALGYKLVTPVYLNIGKSVGSFIDFIIKDVNERREYKRKNG